MKNFVSLILVFISFIPTGFSAPAPVSKLKVPAGLEIGVYAAKVSGARSMTMAEDGTIFVGTRGSEVYVVRDTNGDGKADEERVLLKDLNSPNGVAYKDGDLYVAEISRVLKYPKILSQLSNPPQPIVVKGDFPDKSHHGWKFIAFGPDGKLYVPVGAPCNNCLESDARFASITRMNSDGSGFEIVAHGVRNTVGFDWHPKTKELWFTDNGRDWMGEDLPACEINRLQKVGQHFGFPFCHAGDVTDPEFGKGRPCSEFVPPVVKLGAHVAPLGMRFYTGKSFPAEYEGQVFFAEHGSWNRSVRSGYVVNRLIFDTKQPNKAPRVEPFVTGFLYREGLREIVAGRPVDVLVIRDGSVLISDDHGGAIYRVSAVQKK